MADNKQIDISKFERGSDESEYWCEVGGQYLSGISRKISITKAEKYLEKSMDMGNDFARYNYALLIHKGYTDHSDEYAKELISPLIQKGAVSKNIFDLKPHTPANIGVDENGLATEQPKVNSTTEEKQDIYKKALNYKNLSDLDTKLFGTEVRDSMNKCIDKLLGKHIYDTIPPEVIIDNPKGPKIEGQDYFHKIRCLDYLHLQSTNEIVYHDIRCAHEETIRTLNNIRKFSNECTHFKENPNDTYKFPSGTIVHEWIEFLNIILSSPAIE